VFVFVCLCVSVCVKIPARVAFTNYFVDMILSLLYHTAVVVVVIVVVIAVAAAVIVVVVVASQVVSHKSIKVCYQEPSLRGLRIFIGQQLAQSLVVYGQRVKVIECLCLPAKRSVDRQHWGMLAWLSTTLTLSLSVAVKCFRANLWQKRPGGGEG